VEQFSLYDACCRTASIHKNQERWYITPYLSGGVIDSNHILASKVYECIYAQLTFLNYTT
jgi:hypothetical protein